MLVADVAARNGANAIPNIRAKIRPMNSTSISNHVRIAKASRFDPGGFVIQTLASHQSDHPHALARSVAVVQSPARRHRLLDKRSGDLDTDGRALVLQVHPASVQDRDGAVPLA
jgi:transposase